MENPSTVIPIERGRQRRRARQGRSNCRIIPESELIRVPILTGDQLLAWVDEDAEFDPDKALDWLPFVARKGGPRTFGIPVEDDAMYTGAPQTYRPRSLIFVDPDQRLQVQPGDRVIALLRDGRTIVFRQLDRRGNELVLEALNPAFPPIIGSFAVLGKVVSRLLAAP